MLSPFRGGIHPSENKHFSVNKPFTSLSIPHLAYLPLKQHIGSAAKPLVKKEDFVQEGQKIAEAEGPISSHVHSSIPGKVIDITETETIYGNQPTIIIEAEGSFTNFFNQKKESWENLTPPEILEKIKAAGIVGLGGAAFPTNVKLSPPPGKKIETLIINGAECEPYLTVDDMLMQTFPKEIIEGIKIVLKILGIKKAIIGIEKNKPKALEALEEVLLTENPLEEIEIKPLKTKYPQGAEKQLIYSLLKKEVPSQKLPMDIGVVVKNVGTIFAIREAVLFDKPLFERYITVSGELINNPGNYKVKLGTKISDLINDCGGLKDKPTKIIVGGPMCGLAINNLEMPVVKGFSGILFLSKKEAGLHNKSNCIRCGKCISACPVGLMPCDIREAIESNRLDLIKNVNPFDCIMCSSCSYVCPANNPLSHYLALAQDKFKKEKS